MPAGTEGICQRPRGYGCGLGALYAGDKGGRNRWGEDDDLILLLKDRI